ncbi:MAG: S8 family serine peptidase [Anaerolineales bacterium]|nr:S8 family serine peptidase [Anaerolineales bacterium]
MRHLAQWVRWSLAVALLLTGLGFTPPASAADGAPRVVRKDASLAASRAERARAFAGLGTRLQEQDRVRVIVRLNTGFAPEADLSAAQGLDQRAAIGTAADGLQAELGAAAPDFEALDRLPFAILTVDAQGLAQLQASRFVAGIQEDTLDSTQLGQSTALIGAAGTYGAHALGYTGAGYAVAILDVGVDKLHPFLSGRVVAEACFSTTNGTYSATTLCPNGTSEQYGNDSARPCSVNNLDPLGSCDHGTHVAGIAAGRSYANMVSNGASSLYNGVAPDAGIVAIQVFSKIESSVLCSGSLNVPCYLTFASDQIRALNWVAAVYGTYGIASVNMSLGGSTKYTANCDVTEASRKAAIDNLRAAGVATFIASGNLGFIDGLSAPACISSAISVGSTRDGGLDALPADQVSTFSNSASFLTMLAPGEWIQSATLDSDFTLKQGTSMATPHAAGAWLVYRQRYPTETLDQLLARMLATGISVTDARNSITKPRLMVQPIGFAEGASAGFGQVVVDLTADRVLTLRNPGNKAASLSGASVTGSGIAFKGGSYPGTGGTCGASLAANGTCTIVLRFTPGGVATVSGQLSLSVGATSPVTLALSGVGRLLCPGNLIGNAVFENGTAWSQSSTPGGVLALRTTPVVDGTGPATPADGSGWARFGGYTGGGTLTQAISQTVTIPSGSATLEFLIDISRADGGANGTHTFQATLDGTPVFAISALDQADYATRQWVRLPVNGYANGGSHALRFTAVTPANGTIVNFNLDGVGLCAPAYYPQWLTSLSR